MNGPMPPTATPETSAADGDRLLLTGAAVGLGAMALAGCSGGSGGGATAGDGDGNGEPDLGPASSLEIEAVTITVHTDAAETITINEQATESPDATTHRRRIAFDGSGQPADPGPAGAESVYAFQIVGASGGSLLELIVNPIRRRFYDGASDWDAKHHLLARTGFGVRPDDLARFADVDYDTMVDILVDELRTRSFLAEPDFASLPVLTWRERRDLPEDERQDYNDRINQADKDIRAWWMREMFHTPSPLTERLVLFWHDIWTSSLESSPVPHLMLWQNQLIRRWGTQNFATMGHLLAKDPAMVRYLDSDSNVKESPNENFARELMELFSLGEGQDYEEADIAEIARAFSGYNLSDHWAFDYQPERHDYGIKHYFGVDHDFRSTDESIDGFSYLEGDYVIDQILEKERCAFYVCERLWDEFVATSRDAAVIAAWAATLRANDYAIRPVLKELFRSEAFRSARGSRIKSPVELVIGTYRSLDIVPEDGFESLIWTHRDLQQDLMYPPNVRGWPNNADWINAESYLQRRKHLSRLRWKLRNAIAEVDVTALEQFLLSGPPLGVIRTDEADHQLEDILNDLAYQLN